MDYYSEEEFSTARLSSNRHKMINYNKNISYAYNTIRAQDDVIEEENNHSFNKAVDKKVISADSEQNINSVDTASSYPTPINGPIMQNPTDLSPLVSNQNLIKNSLIYSKQRSLVTVLNISNANIEHLPVDLFEMKNLKTLILDDNRLTTLPSRFLRLTKLEILSICNNQLVNLPSGFSQITKLRELNVEYNAIEYLPDEIGDLKELTDLNIFKNRLSYLPCAMKDLVSLKTIKSEWFNYTKPKLPNLMKGEDGVAFLDKFRKKLKELKSMKMRGMSFRYFTECFSREKINVLGVDDYSRTVLHYACLNEDIGVIKYLCSNFPQLMDVLDRDDLTPLTLSLFKDKHESIKFLFGQGSKLTHTGGKFGSPLHIASKKMNLQLVKEIIKIGGDPNKTDAIGNIPLHYAISQISTDPEQAIPIVQFLLDQNVNPNAKNQENWTPLHLVARKGEIPSLNWILDYNTEHKDLHDGEQTFKLDKRGGAFQWTALHIAAYTGSHEMIHMLGAAGANFFITSSHGYTPKAMIRKKGLALKLIEKYEKEFANSLSVKQPMQTMAVVQSPMLGREFNHASRNRFNGLMVNTVMKSEHNNVSVLSYLDHTRDHKVKSASVVKVGPKISGLDTYELLPEPDTVRTKRSESSRPALEGQSDPNIFNTGDENIETDMDWSMPNSDKNRLSTMHSSDSYLFTSIKARNNVNTIMLADFDLIGFEKRIRSERNFEFNFCNNEIEALLSIIMSNKVGYSEKLKCIHALRILNHALLDHIYRKYSLSVSRDSLPFFMLKLKDNKDASIDSLEKTKTHQNDQIEKYYELVPNGLISLFISCRDKEDACNPMIKMNVCKLLSEIKYLNGISIYEKIASSQHETGVVLMEVKKTLSGLKTLLESTKEPIKIDQSLLKKQYSRILAPKINFNSKVTLSKEK